MNKQNWDIAFDMHLAKYREINPAEAAERTNLEFDSKLSRFKICLLGYELFAEFPEFKLIPADPDGCPKTLYGFQMRILTILVLTAGVYAPSSGIFKAYRELPWGELYDTNFNGRCIKRFAYGFGFKPDIFVKAAEALTKKIQRSLRAEVASADSDYN